MINQIASKLPTSRILKQAARLDIISGAMPPARAYKLGDAVKKIELVMISKNVYKGDAGLKYFWRIDLPVLKFHNDDVEYVVTRVRASKEEIPQVPCCILVHEAGGNVQKIDCRNHFHSEILDKLVAATGATEIPALTIRAFTPGKLA